MNNFNHLGLVKRFGFYGPWHHFVYNTSSVRVHIFVLKLEKLPLNNKITASWSNKMCLPNILSIVTNNKHELWTSEATTAIRFNLLQVCPFCFLLNLVHGHLYSLLTFWAFILFQTFDQFGSSLHYLTFDKFRGSAPIK